MAVDPLVIIIAIILYVPSVIAMTPVIFGIFISKIVLIFLKVFTRFWKNISVMAAAGWYIKSIEGYIELNFEKHYGYILESYSDFGSILITFGPFFLVGFTLWIVIWPIVIIVPLTLYIGGMYNIYFSHYCEYRKVASSSTPRLVTRLG